MHPFTYICIGIMIGTFANSELGAEVGHKAGKWTRELLIKHDLLPETWKTNHRSEWDE